MEPFPYLLDLFTYPFWKEPIGRRLQRREPLKCCYSQLNQRSNNSFKYKNFRPLLIKLLLLTSLAIKVKVSDSFYSPLKCQRYEAILGLRSICDQRLPLWRNHIVPQLHFYFIFFRINKHLFEIKDKSAGAPLWNPRSWHYFHRKSRHECCPIHAAGLSVVVFPKLASLQIRMLKANALLFFLLLRLLLLSVCSPCAESCESGGPESAVTLSINQSHFTRLCLCVHVIFFFSAGQ